MAWAAALVGLPCLEGGLCGVEGWLAGTRVVTGSASCEGGGEGAGAGAGGTASGTKGAGSKGGPNGCGWVRDGQPEVVVVPTWTWSLRGRGGATRGLRLRAAG